MALGETYLTFLPHGLQARLYGFLAKRAKKNGALKELEPYYKQQGTPEGVPA